MPKPSKPRGPTFPLIACGRSCSMSTHLLGMRSITSATPDEAILYYAVWPRTDEHACNQLILSKMKALIGIRIVPDVICCLAFVLKDAVVFLCPLRLKRSLRMLRASATG